MSEPFDLLMRMVWRTIGGSSSPGDGHVMARDGDSGLTEAKLGLRLQVALNGEKNGRYLC